MIGIILKQEGRTDQAIEHYKKALAIDPEAAVAANNLAWIYADEGVNLDEAMLLAKVARRKLPDVPDVADTLGWSYYRTGDPPLIRLAEPLLQEAVTKVSGNPLFRYHLGAVYAKLDKPSAAKQELTEALRINPGFDGSAETRRILATLP
jgi:tetratricopeptide (TPR) repeat protein